MAVRTYIGRRQATVAQWVALWTIYSKSGCNRRQVTRVGGGDAPRGGGRRWNTRNYGSR